MDGKPDQSAVEALLEVMTGLRNPDSGCPWDVEQTFATIAPYTIEEAYEVADAIERGDREALLDELGDLLFQVVFHAEMADEEGAFAFDDVARRVTAKMLDRHPHVFGDVSLEGTVAQTRAWETHKAAERENRAAAAGRRASALDGVAHALPALMRAQKLQKRAARVGFDWPEPEPVFAKIAEELDEIREAIADEQPVEAREDEVGDLLFACVNLARHLDVDAEAALRRANAKFDRRFRGVEAALDATGRSPAQSSLDEMDALWDRIKINER